MAKVLFVPDELEKRLDALSEKLMPPSGPAETLEGELIRAINKILYRFYNDGDYWYEGYGCTTAGPAAAFLMEKCPVEVKSLFDKSDGARNKDYERPLFSVARKIARHVEAKIKSNKLTPNEFDMLTFTSKYADEDTDTGWEDDEDDEDF